MRCWGLAEHAGHARPDGMQRPPPSTGPYHRARRDDGPIALTVNEIRRLFTTLAHRPAHDIAHRLRWPFGTST